MDGQTRMGSSLLWVVLCRDGRPIGIVTVDKVNTITKKTKRRILEAEISDKSKGDVLSKTFAILQTTWFILQCISRTIEDLPATELEIATVAFCVLNFVTYILWWDKPLNVSSPVRVYADGGRVVEERRRQRRKGWQRWGKRWQGRRKRAEAEKEGCIDTCSTWRAFWQALADIPKEVYRPIAPMVKKGVFETIATRPLLLANLIIKGQSYESNPKRMGTFGPKHNVTYVDLITTTAVGLIFGAIHCTAWASQFPSHAEQLLWRVAAISITRLPILISLLYWAGSQKSSQVSPITFVVGVLYILARFTLLVLPLTSLRSLPPGAFNSVKWTRFIPHI